MSRAHKHTESKPQSKQTVKPPDQKHQQHTENEPQLTNQSIKTAFKQKKQIQQNQSTKTDTQQQTQNREDNALQSQQHVHTAASHRQYKHTHSVSGRHSTTCPRHATITQPSATQT